MIITDDFTFEVSLYLWSLHFAETWRMMANIEINNYNNNGHA